MACLDKRGLVYLLCSILITQILIVYILAFDSFSSPPVSEVNFPSGFSIFFLIFISEVLVLELIGLFIEHLAFKFYKKLGIWVLVASVKSSN